MGLYPRPQRPPFLHVQALWLLTAPTLSPQILWGQEQQVHVHR